MDSKSLGPDHYSQFGIAFALQMARPLRSLDDHIKCPGSTRRCKSISLSDTHWLIDTHWVADFGFLSQGCIMTSTIMNKNRRVSLMKQETIGIIWLICDWGISTVPPSLPPKILHDSIMWLIWSIGGSKYYCCSTLINRDNLWSFKYCYITVILCSLKSTNQIKFYFYFCWILHLNPL